MKYRTKQPFKVGTFELSQMDIEQIIVAYFREEHFSGSHGQLTITADLLREKVAIVTVNPVQPEPEQPEERPKWE